MRVDIGSGFIVATYQASQTSLFQS